METGHKNKLTAELEERSIRQTLGQKDVIAEIRAGGAGMNQLFSRGIFRLYSLLAEKRGWQTHLISSNRIGIGGFKVIFSIEGKMFSKI